MIRTKMLRWVLLWGAWLLIALSACSKDSGKQPPAWSLGTVQGWIDQGVLAKVDAPFGPLLILKVQGSHYKMGYQYGYLLAHRITKMWNEVFKPYVGQELGMEPELAMSIFASFLDQGWDHVKHNIPKNYEDEFDGILAGATAAGHPEPESVLKIVIRIMMVGEVAGAIGDDIAAMSSFFSSGRSPAYQEYFGLTDASWDRKAMERLASLDSALAPSLLSPKLTRLLPRISCSFFAAWGDRTRGGQIASRVMDWAGDIGLKDAALVTLFIPDGAAAHVTVGWVGFLGALAGMSERGLALSAVEASSVHMHIHSEPMVLRAREILESATSLQSALPYFTNQVGDGINRPTTIGANAMLAFGDPAGGGSAAEAIALELSGIFASLYRMGPYPGCAASASLYEFALDGKVENVWNNREHADRANQEDRSYEVDKEGKVRTFKVDGQGAFVRDNDGLLIEDPNGQPFRTGYPLPCALYRADTAFNAGVRRWQLAANGPQHNRANTLAHLAGSYRTRYRPHYDMLDAYYKGAPFEWEGQTIIPDRGGTKRPVGVEEAIAITKVVGMKNSNVFSVIYDTTNLVLWVAFESGTGPSWSKASDNGFQKLDLSELIPAR